MSQAPADKTMAQTPDRRLLIASRTMRGLSGKVILLQNNIPALIKAGWAVSLFGEKVDMEMVKSLGATPIKVWGRGINKTHKLRRFHKQHARLLQKQNFDLVVSHGDTLEQDILHVHNSRHMEYEAIYGGKLQPGQKESADLQDRQLNEQRFRLIVANSQLMRGDLINRYGIDPGKIEVVYPGYDPERFFVRNSDAASQALREEWQIKNDEIVVGLVTSGKLIQRGADILIPALAQIPEALRNRARIIIVANDDFKPFMQQAREAGVAGRIQFLEPRKDVESFYNALDIYINPAKIETFGMSLLEAMACGAAAITTKGRVGAAETFTDAMQDWLISAPTPEALAPTLAALLESQEVRQQHAQHCAEAAYPHRWETNIARHLEIYDRVLAEKRAEIA